MDNQNPQDQAVSQQQPEVQTTPQVKKSVNVLLIVVVVLVALLTFSLTAYTFYMLGKDAKEDEVYPNEANKEVTTTEATTTNTSVSEDPYEGWENFTDTDRQGNTVSFKYPKNWVYKEGIVDPPCDLDVNPVFTFTSPNGNIFHYSNHVCGKPGAIYRYLCLFPDSEEIGTEAIQLSSYEEITTEQGKVLRIAQMENPFLYRATLSEDDIVIAVCEKGDDYYVQAWDYHFQITDNEVTKEDMEYLELILKSLVDPKLEN